MAKKRQTKPLQVLLPVQYYHSLMANRFAIQREDGFILSHFGLVDRSNTLMHHFVCVFPNFTLESQKENLLQYSDKIGDAKTTVPSWKAPPANDKDILPVIDFVHVTNWNDMYAEICFMNYSQAQAGDAARVADSKIAAWGIALIRCSLDLQRGFLHALYDGNSL
jgi:hypothetical protein